MIERACRINFARLFADDLDHDDVSRGLTQKMMHGALAELNTAESGQRADLAQTVSRIFLRSAAPGSQAGGSTDPAANDANL
jgi:hypothetical protein